MMFGLGTRFITAISALASLGCSSSPSRIFTANVLSLEDKYLIGKVGQVSFNIYPPDSVH